jgi:hypothetical protein
MSVVLDGGHEMEDLGATIGIVCMFVVTATIVITVTKSSIAHRRRSQAEKVQLEMFNRLVDKMSNSSEMLTWLQTEAGQSLLKSTPEPPASPHNRILNATQAGVVLLFLSAGVLKMAAWVLAPGEEARTALLFVGGVGCMGGLGLLASALFSWGLSRSLGLLKESNNS